MSDQIAIGSSSLPDPLAAAQEAADKARSSLGNRPVTLALVFATGAHLAAAEAVCERIHSILEPEALAGCASDSVLVGEGALEGDTAIIVWAASFDGGEAAAFHLAAPVDRARLPPYSGLSGALLFADRYSYPIVHVLSDLAEGIPGVAMVGGSASARTEDNRAVLFVDDQVMSTGMICVCLRGIEMVPVVAEASVPVGPEMLVTRADRHVVYEISDRPATDALQSALDALTPAEERVLEGAKLEFGIDPTRERHWVPRRILRSDANEGEIVVGATIDTGEPVRLLAYSEYLADDALRRGLASCREALGGRTPAGALVFSCVDRDVERNGHAAHDMTIVSESLGAAPTGGYTSLGEIGPVNGRPRALGGTTVVAVFPGRRRRLVDGP
ncbi:MAG TPA: FIST N-terminal domain-containing protein [Solirubrobacterales bacterium]